jgi:hypothetical protein
MPGKALPVAAIATGGIFLWSALFNKSITSTIQSLVQGQKPQPGPMQPSGFVPSAPAAGQGGSAAGEGGNQPVGAGLDGAIKGLLASLGAPATPANIQSLSHWYTHENVGWPPGCANNPWNSTQPAAGATNCNSVGVKNYPSLSVGVHMNALTMMNGRYPGIVAALRSGRGVCGGGFAGEFSTWSGGGYSSVC